MSLDIDTSSSRIKSSKMGKLVGKKGKNKKRRNNSKTNEEKRAQLLKQWEMMDDEEDDSSDTNAIDVDKKEVMAMEDVVPGKSVGLGNLKWKISERVVEKPTSFLEKQEEEKLGINQSKSSKPSVSKKKITLKIPKESIKVVKQPINEDVDNDISSDEDDFIRGGKRDNDKTATSKEVSISDTDSDLSKKDNCDSSNDDDSDENDTGSESKDNSESEATGDGNGMLNVIDKILNQRVSGKTTVLPHRKTKLMKKREAEQIGRKMEEKKRSERRKALESWVYRPTPDDILKEKALRKVATKGVVALFNTISKTRGSSFSKNSAINKMISGETDVNGHETKTSIDDTELTKHSFLSMLKASSSNMKGKGNIDEENISTSNISTIKVSNLISRKRKMGTDNDLLPADENLNKNVISSKWSVLDDNFVTKHVEEEWDSNNDSEDNTIPQPKRKKSEVHITAAGDDMEDPLMDGEDENVDVNDEGISKFWKARPSSSSHPVSKKSKANKIQRRSGPKKR